MARRALRAPATVHARFLLALALIGLLPLSVVGLGGALLQRQVIAEQSARELTGLARGLAGQLDTFLEPGPFTEVQAIAGLPSITSMDPAEQEAVLRDLFLRYPAFSRLSVFDLSGQRLASSRPGGGPGPLGRPSFQVAAERGELAWEVAPSLTTGRLSLATYAPIRNAERQIVGVLGGTIDMASIASVVRRTPVGRGGRALVVDGDGRVLVHPDRAAVHERRDYSTLGLWGGGRPPGPGTLLHFDEDETWVAGYATVPRTGWTVIVERPEAEVLAPAERSWHLALATLAVAALLALLAAAWSARWLTGPLRRLAAAARALGRGAPDIALPSPGNARDEIGTLVEAFAGMRDAVVAREAALREETRVVETLYRIGSTLTAELDLDKLVQAVTDAGTEVTGAQFGAFFHNVRDERGESYLLNTLSGVPREAFERLPMPRNTAVFGPTFRGEGVVRLDDVTQDPRYGTNAPYHGLPPGHPPVRSYLAVPIRSRSGEVLGGLFFGHAEPGVFTERSERLAVGIAAQAAIALDNAALYAQAQAAVRARDEFLSIAAHELRTPVTGIKGNAQLLLRAVRRGQLEPERLDRSLERLEAAADRLTTLIQDLLDVSRIRLGQLALRPQQVDVTMLVQDLAERYREQLDGGHRLVVQATEPASIIADADRLEQVLSNLLDNAVKYSPEGGPVRLVVEPDPDGVLLIVQDSGIGLPTGTGERIFEPFGRARNATERQVPGMGLGLYVCRNIVERHSGRIWAESPGDGQGTTVRVWLPRDGATLTPNPSPIQGEGG